MTGRELDFITVGDIVTAALGKTIGAANSLPVELQDTALIREVEDINRKFHREGRKRMKKPFWWMEDFYNFTTYERTTISALVANTTTSATIASATGWPLTGGRFYAEDSNGAVDFITFTLVAGVTVTLTPTTIGLDHAASSNVELLYELPPNFQEAIDLHLDRMPYYYVDPIPGVLPNNPYYCFNGNFLVFSRQIGSHKGTLRYWKKPATLTAGTDEVNLLLSTDIPVDYRKYAISSLAAVISRIRRRYDSEAAFRVEAEEELRSAVESEIDATASPFSTIGPSWGI